MKMIVGTIEGGSIDFDGKSGGFVLELAFPILLFCRRNYDL